MAPFLDWTADGNMYVKRDGLVFGLFDSMPQLLIRSPLWLGVRVRTQRHHCSKFAADAKGTVEPDHKGERIKSCGFHEWLDSRHSLI